jgi:hypothetical protein
MIDVNLKIRHAKRQNAQNLDLSCLSLTIVPEDLFSIKTLLNLNLSRNSLTSLDRAVENLKNLTELNLEENQLNDLPIELTNLINLKTVKIRGNPVENFLVDWNFNWKESLKEFLEKKVNANSNSNTNSDSNIFSSNTNTQVNTNSITNKKIPFNFNMTKSSLGFMNNTFTNLNKKESITGEIPKCSLFENSNTQEQNKNLNKIPEEIRRLSSRPKPNTPVRIESANFNKKEALNTILKTRLSIKSEKNNSDQQTESDLEKIKLTSKENHIKNTSTDIQGYVLKNLINDKQNEKEQLQEDKIRIYEDEIKTLNQKLDEYDEEIKKMKKLQFKSEEKNLNIIKQLEQEINMLKMHSGQVINNIHIVDNSISKEGTKNNLNLYHVDQVSAKGIINNKRNWMDDDLPQGNNL